jgi:gas vesicle protein
MTDSPDAIRADIERTRADLGRDVDALADKVTPSKIVDRQVDKVRGAVSSVRERVMGVAEDAASSVSGMAGDAKGLGSQAKHKVEGAPLAVGLIAFGFGLLVAGLIPASTKEKEIAGTVREKAQPLVDGAAEVAKEVAADLKEPAQDAAEAVKERATEAVENVKAQASDATEAVKDQAQQARENVSDN